MSVKESRSIKTKINSTVVLAAILASVVIIIVVINVRPESKDVDSYVDVADMPMDMPMRSFIDNMPIRNFVDKRHELVMLVFRLSDPEHQIFAPRRTSYHARLDETFADFAVHPAVAFIRNMHINWNSAFDFATHIYWNGSEFVFIDNVQFLTDPSRSWNTTSAATFIELLNDFYRATDFSAFYDNNYEHFMNLSNNFAQNIYSIVNFDWFTQFGLNPDNLRIVISPSVAGVALAAWIDNGNISEKIVYAAISTDANHMIRESHMGIVHELAHPIGNPIGDRWLVQDLQFWSWVRVSVASPRTIYPRTHLKAQEYVTRALTILYFLDNTNRNLQTMFTQERRQGFYHIAEVFDMLMRYLGRYEMVQGD